MLPRTQPAGSRDPEPGAGAASGQRFFVHTLEQTLPLDIYSQAQM